MPPWGWDAWYVGVTSWFVIAASTVVMAFRVAALKKQGRALDVPSLISTVGNNIPYWLFLFSNRHGKIGDPTLTGAVWVTRAAVAAFFLAVLGQMAGWLE
jgi:hypothetical protein